MFMNGGVEVHSHAMKRKLCERHASFVNMTKYVNDGAEFDRVILKPFNQNKIKKYVYI